MKRVGRNIVDENYTYLIRRYELRLSLFRRIKRAYYNFRIKRIEKRKAKYASYSGGYQNDLFHSLMYLEMSYLYKIESLYSKQEIRDFERGVRRE